MNGTPARTVIRHLRSLTERQSDTSDEHLLLGYLGRRDEEAFAALVRRHGAMVFSVCRRVLDDEHDAEDAFQATFLVLARRAAAVRSPGSLAAWLHGVACRISLKARAEAARRSAVPLCDSAVPAPADPSWRDVRTVLDQELDRLPENLREPLVLCYLEGLTRDEAAARLSCPLGTLKGRLERGRELLRQRLVRRGVGLSLVLAGALLEHVAVPPALAASAVANVVTRAVPGRVLALAQGISSSSTLTAAKGALALLLVAVGVAGAVALFPSPQPPPPDAPPAEPAEMPKDEGKPRLDALGDPLPDGAVTRLGSLRLFHGGFGAYRVNLSPDAKLVVSTGAQGDNKLWDAVTGRELPLPEGLRKALVFVAKDKLLAAEPQPGGYRIWDLATGKEVSGEGIDVETEKEKVARTDQDVYSPDGKLYASHDHKGVLLFDASTRKELPPLEDQQEFPWSVSFSPDGKFFAVSYTDPPVFVRVWDVATRKVVARQLLAKDYRVQHTCFSADGKTLAGADGCGVTLWDVSIGKWLPDLGRTLTIGSCAFTPDGRTLITGGGHSDKDVRLWDPLTWKESGQWSGNEMGLMEIAVSPDGKTAVTASSRVLRLVDVKTGREIARLGDGKEAIWGVAFSPDGQLLASVMGYSVRLWDMASGEVRSLGESDPGPMRVVFSPDGKYLATDTTSRNKVQLFEVATGREVREFVGKGRTLTHPAFSPDGAVIAAGDSGNDLGGPVHLWDVATGRELLTLGEPMKPDGAAEVVIGAIKFSPDGRTLAVGYCYSDKNVRLWEVASGRERARFQGHQSGVVNLVFSPDGSLLVSGSLDRTALVWDVTGRYTARAHGTDLGENELRALWDALADADAAKAFRAAQTLAGAGRSGVSFMRERLRPAVPADPKAVERLLKDLDSDDFATRGRASKELLALGDSAAPLLRRALDGGISAEARRRVEQALSQLDPLNSPVVLRGPRTVEVLEWVGSPEAGELLQALAGGDPVALLTREAKAALKRTAERNARP